MKSNNDVLDRAVAPSAMLGTLALLSGAGLWYIRQAQSPIARVGLVTGAALLTLAASAATRTSLKRLGWRGAMRRGALVAGTAVFFVAVVAANVMASRHDVRWDLTAAGQNTLRAQTLACLGRLRQTVKVTALFGGPTPDYVRDLLTELERQSNGKVTTEIVDPIANIGYAAQFGNRIDGNDRRVVIRALDGKGKATATEELPCKDLSLTEERLWAALVRATSPRRKVYFTTGHDEYDPSSDKPGGMRNLREALAKVGIESDLVLLPAIDDVPADAHALVVGGAKKAFSASDLTKVARFQDRGGAVLFLLESALRLPPGEAYEGKEHLNPGFQETLRDWGIRVGDDIAVDMANHVGTDVGCPAVSTYPAHDKIVRDLGVTFYIRPRSLIFTKRSKWPVMFAPLVQTMGGSESSFAETSRSLDVKFDAGSDIIGPITMGAVVVRPSDPRATPPTPATKLAVIANASFVTNEYGQRYSNQDFVANTIAWLAQEEPLLQSSMQAPTPPKLEVTSKDLRRAMVAMTFTPFAVMSLGLIVWWRRHGRASF